MEASDKEVVLVTVSLPAVWKMFCKCNLVLGNVPEKRKKKKA